VLIRRPNGRLVINLHRGRSAVRAAFLAPAFASPFIRQIRLAIERQSHIMGLPVRSIDFAHYDDPIIGETLSHFDQVFVQGISTDAPNRVRKHITRAGCKAVAIETSLAEWGVPSLVLFPPDASRVLFDHLVERGHKRIDCLNTLPLVPGIEARIRYWRQWIDEHGIEGTLYNEPVQYYKSPMRWAHERVTALAKQGHLRRGAVFFTGETSGIGATRALLEAGVKVGRDVATCSLGGDGFYEFLNPTMTVVEMPRPEPYLKKYLEWMKSSSKSWRGAVLTTPRKPSLYVGESTGGAR
jgi:DNA-binding LacI/PurR family transcriptional regulator